MSFKERLLVFVYLLPTNFAKGSVLIVKEIEIRIFFIEFVRCWYIKLFISRHNTLWWAADEAFSRAFTLGPVTDPWSAQVRDARCKAFCKVLRIQAELPRLEVQTLVLWVAHSRHLRLLWNISCIFSHTSDLTRRIFLDFSCHRRQWISSMPASQNILLLHPLRTGGAQHKLRMPGSLILPAVSGPYWTTRQITHILVFKMRVLREEALRQLNIRYRIILLDRFIHQKISLDKCIYSFIYTFIHASVFTETCLLWQRLFLSVQNPFIVVLFCVRPPR